MRSSCGPVRSSSGPVRSSGGPVRSSGGPVRSSGGPVRSSCGPVRSSCGPVRSLDLFASRSGPLEQSDILQYSHLVSGSVKHQGPPLLLFGFLQKFSERNRLCLIDSGLRWETLVGDAGTA